MALARPQEPVAPLPYRSIDVVVAGGSPGVNLGGTLCLPGTSCESVRVPAVLLVPGSGPQDRDETICGHKPFLVLSDHLVRRGIAVLRMDDRGVGASDGDKEDCTHIELLADLQASLAWLRDLEGIDPKRVGLVGHSEGASLAAAVAGRDANLSFVVLMACASGRGDEVIHIQSELIARSAGASDAQIAHERRMNQALFAALSTPSSRDQVEAVIRPILFEHLRTWPAAPEASEAELAASADAICDVVLSRSFRSFIRCELGHYLTRLTCPVLALFGGRDLQVPPPVHRPRMEAALRSAGNEAVTVVEFPELNHLFQTCEYGGIDEYEKLEETIAPEVLECIGSWVVERLRPATPSFIRPPPDGARRGSSGHSSG